MNKFALVTAALVMFSLPAITFAADNMPSTGMEKAISKLPQDKAEEFRDTLQSAHEENAPLYDQAQQERAQLHDILAADNFDRDAFVAKNEELRKTHDKIRQNLDEAFAAAVSNLSTDQRQSFVASLEHQHKMHKAMKAAE